MLTSFVCFICGLPFDLLCCYFGLLLVRLVYDLGLGCGCLIALLMFIVDVVFKFGWVVCRCLCLVGGLS